MGACYSKSGARSQIISSQGCIGTSCKNSAGLASAQEIECLKLIYNDLVLRNPSNILDLRTLECFFHLNTVLSTSLTRKLGLKSSTHKQLTEDMFVYSAIKYVKGLFEEKLKFLFCLYDIDDSQGLSFNELLAVLLNSPEELKDIIANDDFLRTLSKDQLSYYILTSTIAQQMEVEEPNRVSLFPHLPLRKKSTQIVEQDLALESFASIVPKKSTEVEAHYNSRSLIEEFKQKINKTLHTAQLIRRYSEYLFKSSNLDIEEDEMSFQIFKFLVKAHPKIYQRCFEGFHQYLWLHPNGVPFYKLLKYKIASCCQVKTVNISKEIYLVHLKNSLLIFTDETMNHLESIKNLEGLNIEELGSGGLFGFVLRHRDGFYPEFRFYFNNEQTQRLWVHSLKEYLEQSVFKVYKLDEIIGKGSFCSVYKCENIKTGEKKAMKIIDKLGISPQQIAAINSQSQILATCAMPNVLKAYQRFQTKQNIYLITQLIGGGTLYEYVTTNNRKSLPEQECKEIMKELLQAVSRFHQIGIIHRDLKLQNILMKKNQGGHVVPKIIDFGLAIYKIDLINMEDKIKFVGTPNFAGPEIYMNEDYNQTIDVFSLGVIMHFLITGSLPFNAAKFETVRELTLQCHLNFASKRWTGISEEAKNLISQMLTWKDNRISAQDALAHQWFQHSHH